MSTIQITLSEEQAAFVKEQAAKAGQDTGEYVVALIYEERKRLARERLEELLLEGLRSGDPICVNEEYWRQKKEKLTQELQRRESVRT